MPQEQNLVLWNKWNSQTFPDCVWHYSLTHLGCSYKFYAIFSGLLPYTDSFPSPFCFSMHWTGIFTFLNKNNQQSRKSDNARHFSVTINKTPWLSPEQINSRTFSSYREPSTGDATSQSLQWCRNPVFSTKQFAGTGIRHTNLNNSFKRY